jgi:hypothetical protein
MIKMNKYSAYSSTIVYMDEKYDVYEYYFIVTPDGTGSKMKLSFTLSFDKMDNCYVNRFINGYGGVLFDIKQDLYKKFEYMYINQIDENNRMIFIENILPKKRLSMKFIQEKLTEKYGNNYIYHLALFNNYLVTNSYGDFISRLKKYYIDEDNVLMYYESDKYQGISTNEEIFKKSNLLAREAKLKKIKSKLLTIKTI